MKSSSRLFFCTAITLLVSACTTTDTPSTSASLQLAYLERGININPLGQLEPEMINDCQVDNYYWKPHATFDKETISNHFNMRYTGMVLEVIDKDGDLYVTTPDTPFTQVGNTLSDLPLLNKMLAPSINESTKFIINIEQLSTSKTVSVLLETLKESHNDNNITVVATEKQKQVLTDKQLSSITFLNKLPQSVSTTQLALISLCQSLSDELINGSYVSDKALLARLNLNSTMSFIELVKTLPHDADFSNLQQQQNLWRKGQYQLFDGQVASLIQEAPTYKQEKIDSGVIKRDREEIKLQKSITIKINQ